MIIENKTKNKISAMVMAEVLIALFLCSILMTMSIMMFKSRDVTKTPYLYSLLKHLPEVNREIKKDCLAQGHCEGVGRLPLETSQYCQRLVDIFSVGSNYTCESSSSGDLKENFKVSNGLVFYDINSGWKDREDLPNVHYIDAFVGVYRNDKKIGTDVFPIRIFNNGDVIPAFKDDYKAYDDDEYFAYRIILNRALDEHNIESRVKNVINVNKNDEPYREKISFKEAVCSSNPEYFSRFLEKDSCENITILESCDFKQKGYPKFVSGAEDKSAYCTIEPVKPRGSGIFKMFGI